MQRKLVSKAEFAAAIGVTPGRVSQYLADGKLSAAAVVGRGRYARIDIETAKAELRISLHVAKGLACAISAQLGEPVDEADPQAIPPNAHTIPIEILSAIAGKVFRGLATELAADIAKRFDMPERDVLSAINRKFIANFDAAENHERN